MFKQKDSSDPVWGGDLFLEFIQNIEGQFGLIENNGTYKPAWSSWVDNFGYYAKPFVSLPVYENRYLEQVSVSDAESMICHASNSITAGPSFTMESGSDVSLLSGNHIVLQPDFAARSG